MGKIDVERYIDELKGSMEEKEADLYSLKKALIEINESSDVFDNFEKEAASVNKNTLKQIENLSSLIKIKKLASEIKDKRCINDKLHTLHFSLNTLKNSDANDVKAAKNAIDVFLYNKEVGIDSVISELNDFKAKLDEIKRHHSHLLPKSLDNRLEIESKYRKHIEQLHSIHKKQKNALVSTVKLFLKLTKKYVRSLQKFKN